MASIASNIRSRSSGDGVITGQIFWSAVVAGAIVSLVVQLLLSLLGAGVGAATFDPSRGDTLSGENAAWAGLMWWLVAGVVAAFTGGLMAGWVAGWRPRVDTFEGTFQGFMAWSVATLIVAVFVLGLAGGATGISARLGGPMAGDIGAVERTAAGNAELTTTQQEEMADAAAQAAIWSFVALLLGAGIATLGGYVGVACAKRTASRGATATAPVAAPASTPLTNLT